MKVTGGSHLPLSIEIAQRIAATGQCDFLDVSGWPAIGRQLQTVTSQFATNVYTFDAADTVSTGSSATLANVYGCLVYDDTITTPVADQGLCFNYFGGANSVTDGTFTIAWSASGILSITA